MGRTTEWHYRKVFQDAGVLEGPADDLPAVEVLKAASRAVVAAAAAQQEISSVEPWRGQVVAMVERGAGARAIFDRLRVEHSDFASSESAVKRFCARLRRERGISLAHTEYLYRLLHDEVERREAQQLSQRPRRASWPSASTCSCVSGLKTLAIPAWQLLAPRVVNVRDHLHDWLVFRCSRLAGFDRSPRPRHVATSTTNQASGAWASEVVLELACTRISE